MPRKIHEPDIDADRTRQLGLPELWVQAGCGDDFAYHVCPKWTGVPFCPHCGCAETTVHMTRTRMLYDILPNVPEPKCFIKLHFDYRSYQCSACKNVFVPEYAFASPKSRMTHRFEDFLVRTSINYSLDKVSRLINRMVSPAAIKQLIDRWLQEKVSTQPSTYTARTLCLLTYENSQSFGLLVLNVDNGHIYLVDVLPEASAEALRAKLRLMEADNIRQIITDLTESTVEVVTERLPGIPSLIDPGTYYSIVQSELQREAESRIRWLPMRDKMEVIMTPQKKLLASQQYTFRQILQRRPELLGGYTAYNRMYNILTEGWSTQLLTEWAESILQSGPDCLAPIAQSVLSCTQNIKLYEQAGFSAMEFSSISEQITRYTRQLRPCSFALEKVRLLYLNASDTVQLEDGSIRCLGVPIEKVLDTLKELIIEQERIYEP